MKTRIRAATALGAVALVGLSGCMKMDMELELHPGDEVSATMITAVSREFAELAGETPESMAEQMTAEMADVDGARVEPYDDGTYVGTTSYVDAVSLQEWQSDGASEELRITRDGDDYVVTGVLDLSEAGGLEEFGLTVPLDIRVAVTFPGGVTEHNGSLSGSTVEWLPAPGERLEIHARGPADGGGAAALPWVLIGIIAVAVLVIAVVVILLARRRPTPTAPQVAGTYPPVAGAPGAPPTGYAQPAGPGPGATTPPSPPSPPTPPTAPPAPPTAPPAPPAPPTGPPAPPQP